MTSERIKEIQMTTAYPDSVSVKQALLQVWNECEQGDVYLNALKNIEKLCDNGNESHEAIWRIAFDAINNNK